MPLNGVILDTNARTRMSDDPGACTVQPQFVNTTSIRVPAGGVGLELAQIYLPYSWYSVDSNTNVMVMSDPAVPLTLLELELDQRTYTGTTLASWLQAALNAYNSGAGMLGVTTWSVFYDVSKAKLSISNTSAQEFVLNGSVPAFTAEDIFGILPGTDYTSTGASFTGPNISQILHSPYVHVIIGWEGLRTLVTANTEQSSGGVIRQSGYKQEVGIMKAPAGWLQSCTGDFINKPKWLVHKLPETVSMELFSHDWRPISLNGLNWAIHFRLMDMPGERLSDNHVILANPEERTILSNAASDSGYNSFANVKNPRGPWAIEQRGTKRPAPNDTRITHPPNKRVGWNVPE